jgi:UDPglucose 6-dehydrogenase
VALDHDLYRILDGADALLLVTEWNKYRLPNFELMRDLLRKRMVFDGRNL